MRHTTLILSLLSLLPLISAHGLLEQITVAGKPYAGPPSGESGNTPPSVIRQIRNNSPVDGGAQAVNNKFMSCGNDAKPGALEADAMPGDVVEFKWSSSWPHLVGPMITYMASCGQTCTTFDSSLASWFKIDQKAFKSSSSSSYLIRHEIIASHNIPVEYYPMCAQLKIGGSGTGVPAAEELVKFPGAYSGAEGALNKNGYQYRRQEGGFEFPGPKISILAGGEGGGTVPAPVPAPEAPAPNAPEQPYGGESGSCSTNYKRNMVRRRFPIDGAHGHAAKRSSH
ncbi:glycosyl hydrolase family 61-domain-containing protein [Coprinopsis sp. MPI-PUGE-AT-0042]|nr:glycosyl hydrolase family 61-domain-containing protein [Coprinopsis sp. MPI-PUGE-AT-0042]